MNFIKLSLLILTILLSSYKNKQVELVFEGAFCNESKILINNKPLECQGENGPYTSILIKKGIHKIKINDEPVKTIEISKRGGFLNLGRKEYVEMPIAYENEETNYNSNLPVVPIIVDSLVIYDKSLGKNQKELFERLKKNHLGVYMANYIRENELYTSKSWTYGINEEIADSITIYSDPSRILATQHRTKMITMDKFILQAKLSEKYNFEPIKNDSIPIIINIIRRNKLLYGT